MEDRPRRRTSAVFSLILLAVAVVSTAATAVAATAESPDAVADTRPTAATVVVAAADQTTVDDDDDDEEGGGGGGVLDSVFPFRAIQLYNAVAGYLEYFYETLIAPITGKRTTRVCYYHQVDRDRAGLWFKSL